MTIQEDRNFHMNDFPGRRHEVFMENMRDENPGLLTRLRSGEVGEILFRSCVVIPLTYIGVVLLVCALIVLLALMIIFGGGHQTNVLYNSRM